MGGVLDAGPPLPVTPACSGSTVRLTASCVSRVMPERSGMTVVRHAAVTARLPQAASAMATFPDKNNAESASSAHSSRVDPHYGGEALFDAPRRPEGVGRAPPLQGDAAGRGSRRCALDLGLAQLGLTRLSISCAASSVLDLWPTLRGRQCIAAEGVAFRAALKTLAPGLITTRSPTCSRMRWSPPVLTAHPTEVRARAVSITHRLAQLRALNDSARGDSVATGRRRDPRPIGAVGRPVLRRERFSSPTGRDRAQICATCSCGVARARHAGTGRRGRVPNSSSPQLARRRPAHPMSRGVAADALARRASCALQYMERSTSGCRLSTRPRTPRSTPRSSAGGGERRHRAEPAREPTACAVRDLGGSPRTHRQ